MKHIIQIGIVLPSKIEFVVSKVVSFKWLVKFDGLLLWLLWIVFH